MFDIALMFAPSIGCDYTKLPVRRSSPYEDPQELMYEGILFLGETSTIAVCFCGFVVPGAPECSTGRLIFVVFGEARDRTCDPWFARRVT